MTGRKTDELLETGDRTNSRSYRPQRRILERGEGMRLFDREGRTYLDFLAGIAVSTLGHTHPGLVEALQGQVERLLHVSNAFYTEPQILLQELLVEHSFADRVFFCNSGAEANEAAIKLARRWQRVVVGTPRFEVLTFGNAFHGRTYGALSATPRPAYHAGFEPMVPGFVQARFNDLASVEEAIGPHTAAILVEPVQGEGGIFPAEKAFLQGLRDIADREGIVLIFDEVQTGIGRCGTLLASQHYGVRPDITSLAKGIGGGLPLGAMLATERLSEGFARGSHATTYGGNPLATRAGLFVVSTVLEADFLASVNDTGHYFRRCAQALCARWEPLEEVRGLGLMNGIATKLSVQQSAEIVADCAEAGLLLNTAGGTVLRFVPPLIAGRDHVDEAFGILEEVLAGQR